MGAETANFKVSGLGPAREISQRKKYDLVALSNYSSLPSVMRLFFRVFFFFFVGEFIYVYMYLSYSLFYQFFYIYIYIVTSTSE